MYEPCADQVPSTRHRVRWQLAPPGQLTPCQQLKHQAGRSHETGRTRCMSVSKNGVEARLRTLTSLCTTFSVSAMLSSGTRLISGTG